MTQLSLDIDIDEPPNAYLIDDPVEKLEMHHPRETLLWLLEQQYGPEVKLGRTKDGRANGGPTSAPVLSITILVILGVWSISISTYVFIVRAARRPEPYPNCLRITKLIQQIYCNTFCKTLINFDNALKDLIPISRRSCCEAGKEIC